MGHIGWHSRFEFAIKPLRTVDARFDGEGSLVLHCDVDIHAEFSCRLCHGPSVRRDHLLRRRIRDLDHDGQILFLEFCFPRVECATHGVVMAYQSFFDAHSSFTFAFENFALSLVSDRVSASEVARQLRITRPVLARILDRAYRRRRVYCPPNSG